MKNSLQFFLMSLLALMFVHIARAQFNYSDNGNGTVTITGYTGPGGAVTIPGTINGEPVTAIGASAFQIGGPVINSVTIPDSVTSIGNDAFFTQTSLTSVNLGNGVTTIGAQAFYACSLSSLTLPSSVASIGDQAFFFNLMTSVNIPANLTSLSATSFSDCYKLTQFSVDSANPNYSSAGGVIFNKPQTQLFAYPPANTQTSYTIPASVTSVADHAFEYATKLNSVVIPTNVTSLGIYAFAHSGLTSVTIPSTITSISDHAFDNCNSLGSVTFPSDLISIGNASFANCHLASISLPNGLTTIGGGAFEFQYVGTDPNQRNALRSVTIPASVASIGSDAFASYTTSGTGVGTANFLGNAPASFGTQVFDNVANGTNSVVIYYPSGATGYTTPYWNGYRADQLGAATIVSQPTSQTTTDGSTASFSVLANGTEPVNYQWQDSTNGGSTWSNLTNGSVFNNVTSPTLLINASISMNGYQFRVIVSNSLGSPVTSSAASLTVNPSQVTITTQPVSRAVPSGSTWSFFVTVKGTAPISYQWQQSTDGGSTWSNLSDGGNFSGTATASLSVTAALSMNGYEFRAVVGNPYGPSVTSSAATLSVTPASSSIPTLPLWALTLLIVVVFLGAKATLPKRRYAS